AGAIDIAEVGDAGLREVVGDHRPAPAGAYDDDVSLLGDGVAGHERFVRVGSVVWDPRAPRPEVLRLALAAEALLALLAVLLTQLRDVDCIGRRRLGRLAGHFCSLTRQCANRMSNAARAPRRSWIPLVKGV